MTFHIHRVSIRNDDTVIAANRLPSVTEDYAPAKVYDICNPFTGEKIPGATVNGNLQITINGVSYKLVTIQ